VPLAPGTMGSLGALPLHAVFCRLPFLAHGAAVVTMVLVGLLTSQRASVALGEEDPSEVVVDEVAGTLIALGMVRDLGLFAAAVALVLFRVFDITKPGIIDSVQRLRPPGLGIMADDVLAGLAAGALVLGGFALIAWL